MTIGRSRGSIPGTAVDAAGPLGIEPADSAYQLVASLEAARVDRIDLSAGALALLHAGLAVRAFIINGLEKLQRRLLLPGGRVLALEWGIYRLG